MPSDLFYSNESNYANSGGNQFVAYAVRAEKKIGTLRGMCLSTREWLWLVLTLAICLLLFSAIYYYKYIEYLRHKMKAKRKANAPNYSDVNINTKNIPNIS